MARSPNLRITSADINALIYSYLEDAGFAHTAYALRHEGQLDLSPNLNVRIPRGELIRLLNKALLYSEAEAHYRRVRSLPFSWRSPSNEVLHSTCCAALVGPKWRRCLYRAI